MPRPRDISFSLQVHSYERQDRLVRADGAAIFNQATLTVSDCEFTSNPVQGISAVTAAIGGNGKGGAIYNSGSLTLSRCSLLGNTASGGNGAPPGRFTGAGDGGSGSGGAIFNDSSATLTLTNCTLANNSGTGGNGANGSSGSGGNGGSGRGEIFNQGATASATVLTRPTSLFQWAYFWATPPVTARSTHPMFRKTKRGRVKR